MAKRTGMIDHIEVCNEAGRLALVVYLLYGYPSADRSRAAFELLRNYNVVFECGLPVASLSGSSASPTIIRAHECASQTGLPDEAFLSFYATYRPNMLAHVQDEQRRDAKKLFDQVRDFDSVMTDNAELEAVLLEHATLGEPAPLLIQHVSALSEAPGDLVRQDNRVIHLGLARRAGAGLLPLVQTQAAVDSVAAAAPYAKVLCGFGIRDAADVAYIRRLRGVHGVTVGTEAMTRLGEGLPSFESWLEEIDRELDYEFG